MLISQTKAIAKIRAETGRSEQWATATVRSMRKVQDGLRFKVSSHAVDKVIRTENAEIERAPADSTIRPLKRTKAARLRANCI